MFSSIGSYYTSVLIQQPFAKAGPKSAGHACVKELQRHLRDYSKGMKGLFKLLQNLLEIAKRNAILVARNAVRTGSDNTVTEVHELVDYLQSLKSRS